MRSPETTGGAFVALAAAHGRQPVAASQKSSSSFLVFFYFSLRRQGVATVLEFRARYTH
jgi:hypothetical protein